MVIDVVSLLQRQRQKTELTIQGLEIKVCLLHIFQITVKWWQLLPCYFWSFKKHLLERQTARKSFSLKTSAINITKVAGSCGIWSHILEKSLMENFNSCSVTHIKFDIGSLVQFSDIQGNQGECFLDFWIFSEISCIQNFL